MSLRAATPSDIDTLTAIHVLAMPMDPNFPYLFPNVSEYQDEYCEFVKEGITSAMNAQNAQSWTQLIEIEDPSTPSKKRIVAFATWEIPDTHQTPQDLPPVNTESEKPQARIWQFLSKARWDAYLPAAAKARREILGTRYGSRQLFLAEMVVHPDFQRRGLGKLLMRWGVEKAEREGLAIATFASVPGRGLYESVGLREVGCFRTQVDGEEEFVDNPILAMDAVS